LKSISGKEFAKILEKNGWKLARIVGSHHIYIKEGIKERISLPIHSNKDLRVGLIKYFMKIANLTNDDI